jgi:Leucine-rich repeat (LRR) protein
MKKKEILTYDEKNQKLDIIPKSLYSYINLTELDLSRNNIKTIDKEISKLKNLKILNLGKNNLKEIPKEISTLQNLEILKLGANQIKEINKSFFKYKLFKLTYLSLHTNNISVFQEFDTCNLTNLRDLDLSFNKITKLPKTFCNLVNLESLYLLYNYLYELPEGKNNINLRIL